MVMRPLAGLALVATLASAAIAQQPVERSSPQNEEPRFTIQIDVDATVPDGERWLELQSKNFLVAGPAGEDDLRKVAADLELLRETFAQFNPRVRAVSPVPMTVLVFRNAASFRWYRPEDDNQPEKAKGYVQASADTNYIVLTQSGSIPREIYRNYVRLLIPQAMAPVPLWFREGIADYFSALTVNRYMIGDKRWVRLGNGIDEYDHLLDKKAKLFPFDTLFRIHEDSPEYTNPESRKFFLAQSWGVVHYLMSRPGGAASMQRLFNMLGDGETFENGVMKTLGRNTKSLEDDFTRYIRASQKEHQWTGTIQVLSKSANQVAKGECGKVMLTGVVVPRIPKCFWASSDPMNPDRDPPGVFRIPYAFDKTWAEVSPLKARTLSEAEAWFYRGDLMLHIGRLGEADAYLRRAVQQPAQFSRVHASLGLLQIQQKRYDDAEKSLNAALELDPQNYLAHYYRTVLIRLKGLQVDTMLSYDDSQEIHAELLKVLDIAPHFAEAAEMLAAINLVRQTASKESQKFLADELTRYPGRISLWISLANVTARGGDPEGTRWLLTRLLVAAAPDTETRKSAANLLEAIAPGASRALIRTSDAADTQSGGIRVTAAARPSARANNKASGQILRGVLTNIECRNGLTFTVKTGGKNVKLHTNSAFSVEFIARNSDGRAVAPEPVVCGPTAEDGVDVRITYRPVRAGDSIGEPLTVEIRVEN